LDGLSHGYGPLSAMFAGAHRYQSLNGTDESEEETAATETEVKTAVAPSATPPTPRRSFVAWAKSKPKTEANGPAADWTRGPAGAAASAAPVGHSPVQGAPAPKP
jgi:hypothetical protein